MLSYTTVQSLGQVRLEEMHEQARRAALAKTARRARREQRTRAGLAGRNAGPTATRLPLRARDPRLASPRAAVVALIACAAPEPGDLRGQAATRWPARAATASARRWASAASRPTTSAKLTSSRPRTVSRNAW